MTNQNNCPYCSNHCSAEAVRCGRGAAYFNLESDSKRNFENQAEYENQGGLAGRGGSGACGKQRARGDHKDHGNREDHDIFPGYGHHQEWDDRDTCHHGSDHHGPDHHNPNHHSSDHHSPDHHGPGHHSPDHHGPHSHRHGGQEDAAAYLRSLEADTTESQLAARLRECGHHLYHHGLPRAGQLRILYILSGAGFINQRRLQDVLGVKPGSLSEILGKLENAGYIVRSKNEQDRRGVDIAITDEGKEAMEALKRQHEDNMQGMFGALDDGEQQQLLALLDKLLDAWHEEG